MGLVHADTALDDDCISVVICGGGNAAHLLAGLACSSKSKRVKDVSVLNLYKDEFRLWTSSISIQNNEKTVVNQFKLKCVSNDPAEVIPIDLPCMVILVVPSFAHEAYLRAIKPRLAEGSILGALPGYGCFDALVRYVFDGFTSKTVDAVFPRNFSVFATDNLPWACRISSYGKSVSLLGTKNMVNIAVQPSSSVQKVTRMLEELFGIAAPKLVNSDFLSVSLATYWHPIITFGFYRNFVMTKQIEFDEPPLFYGNVDEFTADKICAVSHEILRIKEMLCSRYKIELPGVIFIQDWFLSAYDSHIGDKSSFQKMLNTNEAYQGLTHPTNEVMKNSVKKVFVPDFQYRYLSEDIPFGQIVCRGIAELANIATPNLDEIIIWSQERLGKQYLTSVNGSLCGTRDLMETRSPQRYGFNNLDDFMSANHYS